jgi:hypothetical protein
MAADQVVQRLLVTGAGGHNEGSVDGRSPRVLATARMSQTMILDLVDVVRRRL